LYYFFSRDIKNVEIKGYVLDSKTNEPIENVIITIQSDRYESDKGKVNYDEYLGRDKFMVFTDSKGTFYRKIPKSSFVCISLSKNGYKKHIEKGRISEKKMYYTIKLDPDDE
jgi:hypothetical protein